MQDRQDLAAGAILAAIGLAVAGYAALHYDIGTPRRMGPGFFPLGLGLALALLGGTVALLRGGQPMPRPTLPELVAVLSAIVIFALGVERLGLVLTTFVSVLVASAAAPRGGILWRLLLGCGVCVIAVGVFHLALAMNLPLWPRR
ncbi:tripartite tricarboxylate transporter TctB family protein [Paracoccus jeotgali]|uniref:tripartite tricarboxylate transporter TctB family protein n=1 Tax=Paracoccus jeotgali TaxID=2065379 RepID=UPI0028A6FED3|nr:tripartite tricarboxylate transporter TctB family protein [Paracoccus jeotgali]